MKPYRVRAVTGVTTYSIVVWVRSQDEAFTEVLDQLKPKFVESMTCEEINLRRREQR